jgi:Ca-activated chloride channel family protein
VNRLVAVLAVLLLAAGCTPGSPTPTPTTCCEDTDPPLERGSGTLRVLAGSELKDLADLKDSAGRTVLDQIRADTGVSVALSYVGTLDGMQQVISGQAVKGYEAIWFSSNRYLDLHPGAKDKVGAAVPIMRSPVVLGVRESVAAKLWSGARPSWRDVAERAARGDFTFAMTDPAASNSGFSGLLAMATALSPQDGPVTLNQIQAVAPQLQALFAAQRLTAGSSGWLKDAYIRRMRDRTPIDAMVNYESVLLAMNQDPGLPEKLTLVYPTDGTITADYPLTLLAGANDAAVANHRVVTNYLRRLTVQQSIMAVTHRRPVRPSVALTDEFGGKDLPELAFPDTLDVADALIRSFGNTIRTPPRTIYVLDVSGSMNTVDAPDPSALDQPTPPLVKRIDALRSALLSLTGADTTLAGQFAVFHEREQVILETFSDTPHAEQRFEVPPNTPGPTLDQIRGSARSLQAGGNTALYEALARAYEIAGEATAEARYTTIVLFTDGERTVGRDLAAFRAFHGGLSVSQRQVPVFSVLIGEGNAAELTIVSKEIAGGEFFDARNRDSLAKVFQEIRGYQ